MEDVLTEYPWNIADLKPPRNHFGNSSSSRLRQKIKAAVTKEISNNVYRNQIYIETIALSKFLSQRRNKYRSDKGFKTIKKVDKAVNKMYQLDLPSVLALLKLNLVDTFVPSRQFHQWLLIKFQSYAKLLDRVNYCCRYSATMLNHRLHTGHNWVEVMLALSMTSRIWAVSKFLLKQVCSTYEQLYSVLDQLPMDTKEKQWLHDDYKPPESLNEWLSLTDCDVSLDETRATVSDASQRIKNDAKLRKIIKMKSHEQLKKFVLLETKRRSKNQTKSTCVSKNLDALQWHMFTKKTAKWIRMLKKSDSQCREKLLKRIKIKMLASLL